ncbi:Dipeptidyl aminopeptidase/acylaminoacyl peptidase [Actinopolymorpha cephalotaxi]|uniref:Dipeptidyl aminopeptidase/acylaminoacyl peptidase n=1 Tax=Actinopolymorpha cephalotaxi TaxID=504797 RepID=A0A1I2W306_9ACTN|nr:S9 family peptidase [Actinopolymorpha cephalotaxi]NYH82808.1 dipeptidyl aminopeptidase/acylaminoacyl peptidase [Actinopolymorpha cephalotaxi]SFG95007.1 Dipeptidyl aminopeptidase/acylaminoacyl peptidase [Actinopolymorpha cephalotaxi]
MPTAAPPPNEFLRSLLQIPSVSARDVDTEGRTLVSYDVTGSAQLYEVGADGTWRRLTDLDGVAAGRYLPGTRAVVVQHDAGGNERGQLSLVDLDSPDLDSPDVAGAGDAGEPLPPLVPFVHDPAFVHRLAGVEPGRVFYLTNRRNGVDFDLVSREVGSGKETVLYDGGGYVAEVEASPDGRWVALTRPNAPANSLQLLLVSTEDGQVEPLTPWDDDAYVRTPSWLPDSSALLVSGNPGREMTAVLRYDLAARTWSEVVADSGHDLVGWVSPDGAHVLVATNDDGAVSLALHSLPDGEPVRDLDLPAGGCAALHRHPDPVWSQAGDAVAVTYSSPVEPPYALRLDVTTGTSTPIRPANRPDLPGGLVAPESHRVAAPDGEQIPTFVYRPADGGDGSAVLVVHGGPEGQSVRQWQPMVAGLVAQGHTVLVPNVRGSTGYGKRWYALDDVRRRLDSVADLAALHEWLPTIGVDPDRVALYGGSYGGYMVLAGLAFQPARWAAGVDIVGIASLVTFLENTSDYRRAHREREYGSLANDRDFLHEASPLTQVDAMRAPLFVIHGANDPRVPLSEAEQIVAALRARNVPCELRVYADEGHGLAKRANQLDAYPAACAFLAEQLAKRSGGPGDSGEGVA